MLKLTKLYRLTSSLKTNKQQSNRILSSKKDQSLSDSLLFSNDSYSTPLLFGRLLE